MISKSWETILDYFKEKPYWSRIQPVFMLFSLYLTTLVLAYQFIQWQYGISLRVSLYLSSYVFKQITISFIAIGIIGFIFSRFSKREKGMEHNKAREFIRKYSRIIFQRSAVIGLVLVIFIPIFMYFSPHHVSHIRIKFLEEPMPDFHKYAFVYLIYELNKLQQDWYFEIDFDVFDDAILTTQERERCGGENKTLCYAEILSNDMPFIGITTKQLGQDFFWQNHNKVSVISTFRWEDYSPPSTYEFLTYSIIVQSILIHLNAHCGGLPESALKQSRVAYGDLFQFSPRRNEMKSAILAAHLSPKGEELLLNCFGVEYVRTCSNLLTLEWLHSKKVTENLDRSFHVKL